MGASGTQKKKEPQIYDTDKKVKTIKNEAIIPGYPIYIPDEKLSIILKQKEKSICKILKNEKPIGTGFLCSITGQYKKEQL